LTKDYSVYYVYILRYTTIFTFVGQEKCNLGTGKYYDVYRRILELQPNRGNINSLTAAKKKYRKFN
jgi:hypothetical protein